MPVSLRRRRDLHKTCAQMPLRIAFVLGTLDIGGTERQLCRLASELTAAGNIVTVVVIGARGPLYEFLANHEIPVVTLGFEGFGFRDEEGRLRPWVVVQQTFRLSRLVAVLRSFKPDVCYSALFWAIVFAMPAASLARVPVRVSGRRGLTSALELKGRYRLLNSWTQRSAHSVVANCEAVAYDVAKAERLPAARIRVIHNGVDLPDAQADVGRQPAVGIMVANLIGYKGHEDVLRALAMLENPPEIRMIGDGGERLQLAQLIDQLNLRQTCSLEGAVPEAEKLFIDAQFALLASHTEGLPNAVLEAMAAGVPVVATRVGGVPELVEDGVTGLLVPPRDPPALAEALAHLAGDADLRVRMGAAARRRAACFSYKTCRDKHLHLFRELMQSG